MASSTNGDDISRKRSSSSGDSARVAKSVKAKEEFPISSLVVLIFSKITRVEETWLPLASNIALALQDELDLHKTFKQTPPRLLDADVQGMGRVAELTLPLILKSHDGDTPVAKDIRPALTLPECTALCNSNPIAMLQSTSEVELVLQPGELYSLHSEPGLAVFDMDSTLIQQEVIDELARAVGLYEQVSAITEAAMRGEAPYTDFEASLRARVACLRGVPVSIWEQLKLGTITFTPGAAELVRVLKRLGWKTAVLSGGFTPLANWVKETLGLDYAYANHLVNDDASGVLTGELVLDQPIIHAEKKRELLMQLAKDNDIPAEKCIAVGDGSNDLLMMGAAGLGIAFNAKPKVQLAAPTKLNSEGLLDVLYLLGRSSEEIKAVLAQEMIIHNGKYVLKKEPPASK